MVSVSSVEMLALNAANLLTLVLSALKELFLMATADAPAKRALSLTAKSVPSAPITATNVPV